MSRPVIHALLGNSQHPEYGSATIPFPLSREEYPNSLELLSALEIGDAVCQDCTVLSIQTEWTSLWVLEGQSVNVDELDYLAKRLDSFSKGETAQFEGMADLLKLKDIKDLINLTFCCQRATVITDFSNLEEVGKTHYMNLHGGCVPAEELENLDGVETAHLLIRDDSGTVTPYGVVYDNGMKLEQHYDGRHFPCYHYDDSLIVAGVTSCYAPRDETPKDWIYLPASQCQIDRVLARAGIQSTDEAILCGFENTLPAAVEQSLVLESESIEAINDLCAVITPLDPKERTKLEAVVAMAAPNSAAQITYLAENLDQFNFVPGVHTPEEYGRYMIQESGRFEYDDNLEGFYDFEGYARQQMSQELGQFVENGYISYHGFLSLEEVMAGSRTFEEGFQMGGMQ